MGNRGHRGGKGSVNASHNQGTPELSGYRGINKGARHTDQKIRKADRPTTRVAGCFALIALIFMAGCSILNEAKRVGTELLGTLANDTEESKTPDDTKRPEPETTGTTSTPE